MIDSRRAFLKKIGLAASSLALTKTVPGAAAAAGTRKRPNILFIMSDDHAAPAIGAYKSWLGRFANTPNIDRLAREGMMMRSCFVTNSICTPSRAAILTGKYSHMNGVYKFTPLDQRQPTLPKLLRKAGYHTAIVGKYHLHSNPEGFDYWSVLPGQGRYHNPQFVEMGDENANGRVAAGRRTTYEGHSSDVVGDKALHYLKTLRPKDKPFFFMCHFKAPHDTWECARRYESLHENDTIPEPPTLFDDYKYRSDALGKSLQYIGSRWGNHTNFKKEIADLEGIDKKKAQYQLYIKKYLRCVAGVDHNVGRVLDYLDESGLARDTLVVYTADQGFFLGEHGLYDKRFMYEEALRMPFLARYPGVIAPKSVNEEDIVLNVDFAPTFLEAVGAAPHPEMQGRSFINILRGRTPDDWREAMYYRYYFSHFDTEPHYGIRTKLHKLIRYNRLEQWELFDLKKDPLEMRDLSNDPEYKAIFENLKANLKRLQTELKDNIQDVGNKPRDGMERFKKGDKA